MAPPFQRNSSNASMTPNATLSFGLLSILIGTNVAIFLYAWLSSSQTQALLFQRWAISPAQLVTNLPTQSFTLVTSLFLHGSVLALVGNCLVLGIVGPTLIQMLGRLRFLLLYSLCALVATLAQVAIEPITLVFIAGAGRGIVGLLGAYGVLFGRTAAVPIPSPANPRIAIPLLLLIALWFGHQMLGGLTDLRVQLQAGSPVLFGQLAGLLAGVILTRWLIKAQQRVQ